MKANAIILNSEHTGEIIKVDLNDEGTLDVVDGEYYIDKTVPIYITDKREKKGGIIKKFMKRKNSDIYYMLKADTIIPIMTEVEKKKLKFNMNCPKCGTTVATYPAIKKIIKPMEIKSYKSIISPKALKDTIEMRFLKQLKKYSEPEKSKFKMRNLLVKVLYLAFFGIGAYVVLTHFRLI